MCRCRTPFFSIPEYNTHRFLGLQCPSGCTGTEREEAMGTGTVAATRRCMCAVSELLPSFVSGKIFVFPNRGTGDGQRIKRLPLYDFSHV